MCRVLAHTYTTLFYKIQIYLSENGTSHYRNIFMNHLLRHFITTNIVSLKYYNNVKIIAISSFLAYIFSFARFYM